MGLFRLLVILRQFYFFRLDSELLASNSLPWQVALVLKILPWRVCKRCDVQWRRGVRLRLFLESLGPVFIKFGQLLSTRPDLVPPDIAVELDKLQDRVPPFDSEVFVAVVERVLGGRVEDIFARFEREPLASASMAQVHTAKLHNGDEVVVKVARPGVEKTIAKDMALMKTVAVLVEKCIPDGRRLHPVEVVADYENTIFDELNLQREAANTAQLGRNFAGSPMLYVPRVYWDYCRPEVMVTERIYGIPVADIDALTANGTDLKLLAHRGVEIFFTQVLEHNFFHADMHPGNIFVSTEQPHNPQYIAIDCAIVGTLSRDDQYYMARNMLAIFQRNYREVAELHVQCGWIAADTRIGDFEAAIRTVCEPIFEKPIAEISFGQVLLSLFQTARRYNMQVQPSLVLLQKTLLNIEGLGRQLYPQLDLWQTALPFLERWMTERYRPKFVLKGLRYHVPHWLERMPEVPDLLFDAASQIRALEQTLPALQASAAQMAEREQHDKRARRRQRAAALLLVVAAIAWPQLEQAGIDWRAGVMIVAAGWLWLR